MRKSQVTVRLDKGQLVRARRALGADTVTETIERALALATEKATHDGIIRKYSGVGGRADLRSANLAVLDTSVYIENFRSGRFTLPLLRAPWIVRCSAVVLHEPLRRGARTPLELRFVGELARRVGVVTPTEKHWLESAEVLSRMSARRGYTPGKLRDLAFDTLIALSARDAGAVLVTCDRNDFAEIGKWVAFRALFW